jgi:chromate reductase, NAD(P)H dehydrogenase (quinone)
MISILGISGSLRARSYNTALLRLAQSVAGPEVSLDVATLHGIPLYDGDLEQREGVPATVRALKARMLANHALLLATPEYNHGIPGVFKNAIDWLSRPPAEIPQIFGGRPVALMGASPGAFGTILAQAAWLPVLNTLGTRHWSQGRLRVSRAGQLFDDSGTVKDEAFRQQVADFVSGFARFVQTSAAA